MNNDRKKQLLRASVELGTRATNTAWKARLFSSEEDAGRLLRKSYIQNRAAIRLMKIAGVLTT
jgi:predicted aldo/keto reductase-like oxidoreductase